MVSLIKGKHATVARGWRGANVRGCRSGGKSWPAPRPRELPPLNLKSSGAALPSFPSAASLSAPSPAPALESWESSGLPAHACTPCPAARPLATLQGLNLLYLQFCDPFWFPFF